MEIYTIGFTKTTAEDFFGRLNNAGVGRLLDIRLNNSSQLAGFAKARDLPYLLYELVGAQYEHQPLLAPSQEMLSEFKMKREMDWADYEFHFLRLLQERQAETLLPPDYFETKTALLCSEATAEHCHRRLVCDYFAKFWPNLRVIHL